MTAGGEAQRVLYVTHNGLTEPLGRRQVLPYLVGLSERGWRFDVLSFEKAETAQPGAMQTVRSLTARAGIRWHPVPYHRHPAVLATAFDVLRGAAVARALARGAAIVHARSTVPATMVRLAAPRGARWLFDVRGLLADEYADAGHWKRNGWRHLLTSAIERRLLMRSGAVVVLTRRTAAACSRSTTVIPCCVDMESFRPDPTWRCDVRRALECALDPLLVYSGSLGSWYRLGEMLDFFTCAGEEIPGLRFLLLTPQPELADRSIRERGLATRARALKVPPDDVPRYLAAADAGICFLGRHASKAASSPTKYGEYLASGLPVVTNPWVGDAEVLRSEPAWLLVDGLDEASYRRAARQLAATLARDAEMARAEARALAQREFALSIGVDRYESVYRSLLRSGA